MRLLTKKIYRAYPELDKFEDDVCKRYVKRAKRLQNAWKGWAMILISIVVSIPVWIFTGWVSMVFLLGLDYEYNFTLSDNASIILGVIYGTGFIWFPAFVCLLIRDRWLRRCICKQLAGVQCGACGYSLLGLAITEHQGQASVRCPECGDRVLLKDMGLTEADIDPTLVQEPA